MPERGVSEEEIVQTVTEGASRPAKLGRTEFRFEFDYNGVWRGTYYRRKRVTAIAVPANAGWLVLTVIARYY